MALTGLFLIIARKEEIGVNAVHIELNNSMKRNSNVLYYLALFCLVYWPIYMFFLNIDFSIPFSFQNADWQTIIRDLLITSIEELGYRALFITPLFYINFRNLKIKYFYFFISIILSAISWSVMHLNYIGELETTIILVIMGVLLGFIYVKTENIWIVIGLHFLNNFMIAVLTLQK